MDVSEKRSSFAVGALAVLTCSGMIAVFHEAAVPESTKFLLVGVTLLAETLWARRYFKRA